MKELIYQKDGYEIYYNGSHFLLIRRLPDGRYQNPRITEDADEVRKKVHTSETFNISECMNFKTVGAAASYINRIEGNNE